jgi:hypothetical protein
MEKLQKRNNSECYTPSSEPAVRASDLDMNALRRVGNHETRILVSSVCRHETTSEIIKRIIFKFRIREL